MRLQQKTPVPDDVADAIFKTEKQTFFFFFTTSVCCKYTNIVEVSGLTDWEFEGIKNK